MGEPLFWLLGASDDRWLIGGVSPVFTSASLPVCLSPNRSFLKGHQSCWIRIYLMMPLQLDHSYEALFQMRSRAEVLGVRASHIFFRKGDSTWNSQLRSIAIKIKCSEVYKLASA